LVTSHKYKVGITGGIGSGKSTVCRIFELLGLPVFYSDVRAKELIHENDEIITLYKRLFGDSIYICGQLNRAKVAEILFNNPKIKKEVEDVVHPIVRNDFNKWAEMQRGEIVLNEAAILFESGSYQLMDAVITVSAPANLRISRVMNRDGITEREIKVRINNQWPDEKKCALSQYVIECDDKHMVVPQVLKIYKLLDQVRQ
jgi:dephospho-CoA kinase